MTVACYNRYFYSPFSESSRSFVKSEKEEKSGFLKRTFTTRTPKQVNSKQTGKSKIKA